MTLCFLSPKYPIPRNSENLTMGAGVLSFCKMWSVERRSRDMYIVLYPAYFQLCIYGCISVAAWHVWGVFISTVLARKACCKKKKRKRDLLKGVIPYRLTQMLNSLSLFIKKPKIVTSTFIMAKVGKYIFKMSYVWKIF